MVTYEAPTSPSASKNVNASKGMVDSTIAKKIKASEGIHYLRSRKVLYGAPTSPSTQKKVNMSEQTSDATAKAAGKILKSEKVTYEVSISPSKG